VGLLASVWVGGVVPLGYEVQDRKLIVNEEEATKWADLLALSRLG
jgi:hypothetical protein